MSAEGMFEDLREVYGQESDGLNVGFDEVLQRTSSDGPSDSQVLELIETPCKLIQHVALANCRSITTFANMSQKASPQKYRSEIEACIQLGLIDKDIQAAPGGLPPIEPYDESSSSPSNTTDMQTPSSRRSTTPSNSPPSSDPESEVIGGLRKLARMVHRASDCAECEASKKLSREWEELRNDKVEAEQAAQMRRMRIQVRWSELERQFRAIGKKSRLTCRDKLDQEWEELEDLYAMLITIGTRLDEIDHKLKRIIARREDDDWWRF